MNTLMKKIKVQLTENAWNNLGQLLVEHDYPGRTGNRVIVLTFLRR